MKQLLNFGIGLIFILFSAFAGAEQASLARQMWQFAYPEHKIPKTIPSVIHSINDNKQGNVLDFSPQKASGQAVTTVNADYANGYIFLDYKGKYGFRQQREIIAFKDNQGRYTFFDHDVLGKDKGCTVFISGRAFHSNRPMASVFPKITLQTFAPDIAEIPSLGAVYYLDIAFPHRGSITTATLAPLGYPNAINSSELVIYGDFEAVDSPSNGRAILWRWLHQLTDKQSITQALNGEFDKVNQADRQALKQLFVDDPNDLFNQEKHMTQLLQQLKSIYDLEKHIKYRSLKLDWDKDKARFHIIKKIPNKQAVPSTFIDYLLSLPSPDVLCYGEGVKEVRHH